jgi:hypothetical protein
MVIMTKAIVIRAGIESSSQLKLRRASTLDIIKDKDSRKLGSAARAAFPAPEQTVNQSTKLATPSGLPLVFFNNLADHGMLGINPGSCIPLAGVNSKPEQSNQHGSPVHETGPIHIRRANNCVNNFSTNDRVLMDLLEITSC